MNLRLRLACATLLTTACPSDAPVTTADTEDDGGEDTTGGTGAPTTGDTPEPLTEVALADFFERAEEAYCARAVECREFGGLNRCKDVMHMEVSLSLDRLTGVGGSARLTLGYLMGAVEIGRIEYDPIAAATCLNYAATRTCEFAYLHDDTEAELAGQAACLAMFRGTMEKNGPCATALECEEEAICGFNPMCTDMCCAGACRVLPPDIAEGQPCGVNPNAQCVAGTVCEFDQDAATTLCLKPAQIGDSCEFNSCAAGTSCEYDGVSFTCVEGAAVGESCVGKACVVGALCVYDEFFEDGECVAPADEGEDCVYADYERTCRRYDNYCDPDTLKCVPLPGNGERCDVPRRCLGDLFCAYTGDAEVCSPLADEGEKCGYDQEFNVVPCSGDSACDYDGEQEKCVAPTGERCPAPADTQEG